MSHKKVKFPKRGLSKLKKRRSKKFDRDMGECVSFSCKHIGDKIQKSIFNLLSGSNTKLDDTILATVTAAIVFVVSGI